MIKPDISGMASGIANYVLLVDEADLNTAFANQEKMARELFVMKITEEIANHAYAPGKWSLKELLQHIIDCERIFAFRALCFARSEKQALPGFEENDYAAASNANRRSWAGLCEEFFAVRKTTEMLYGSFTEEMLHRVGKKEDDELSPILIGYAIVGHCKHHFGIIEERYLKN